MSVRDPLVVSYGPPGFQLGVLGHPGCRLGAPGPPGLLVGAPWLLVRGPRTPLSLIILLITGMGVITEKKTATKHR